MSLVVSRHLGKENWSIRMGRVHQNGSIILEWSHFCHSANIRSRKWITEIKFAGSPASSAIAAAGREHKLWLLKQIEDAEGHKYTEESVHFGWFDAFDLVLFCTGLSTALCLQVCRSGCDRRPEQDEQKHTLAACAAHYHHRTESTQHTPKPGNRLSNRSQTSSTQLLSDRKAKFIWSDFTKFTLTTISFARTHSLQAPSRFYELIRRETETAPQTDSLKSNREQILLKDFP